MTKVTLRYDLAKPLTEADLENVANVRSTYGIAGLRLSPALDQLIVDYDASRLMQTDVEAELTRHGLPIRMTARAC